MLISIFGAASPLTIWGAQAVRILSLVTLQEYDYIHANDFEDLREKWASRKHEHVVFFSDCPDQQIVDLFIKAGVPLVVFVDDPFDIEAYARVTHGLDCRGATRLTCRMLSCLHDLFLTRNTMIVDRSGNFNGLRQWLVRISDFFGVALSNDNASAILESLNATDATSIDAQIARVIGESQLAAQRAALSYMEPLFQPTLESFRSLIKGQRADNIIWPREMFLNCAAPGEHLIEPILLTGPARMLVYGPYLFIPAADWVATVQIEVVENISGNHLIVDVNSGGGILFTGTGPLPEKGMFLIRVPFTTTDPRDPIELRLAIKEGALDGRLNLRQVRIRRYTGDGFIEQLALHSNSHACTPG